MQPVPVTFDTFQYPLCHMWSSWQRALDNKDGRLAGADFLRIHGLIDAMQAVFSDSEEGMDAICLLRGVIDIQADKFKDLL